jgi:hypothetical protein
LLVDGATDVLGPARSAADVLVALVVALVRKLETVNRWIARCAEALFIEATLLLGLSLGGRLPIELIPGIGCEEGASIGVGPRVAGRLRFVVVEVHARGVVAAERGALGAAICQGGLLLDGFLDVGHGRREYGSSFGGIARAPRLDRRGLGAVRGERLRRGHDRFDGRCVVLGEEADVAAHVTSLCQCQRSFRQHGAGRAHLPPAVAVLIIFIENDDGLSRLKADLVRVLRLKGVNSPVGFLDHNCQRSVASW